MADHDNVAWYINRDGERFGPFSTAEFAEFEATSQIKATDHIWRTGLDDWLEYPEYKRVAEASQGVRRAKASRDSELPKQLNGAHLIARKLLRVPRGMVITIFHVLTQPTAFAKQRIDTGPRALHRALYFYFSLFSIAFLITSSVSHLYFLPARRNRGNWQCWWCRSA